MSRKNRQQILNFSRQILSDTIHYYSFLTDNNDLINSYLSKLIYAVFAENKESMINFFNEFDQKEDYPFSKTCNLLFLGKAYKLIKNNENLKGCFNGNLQLVPFEKLSLKEKSLLFFRHRSTLLVEDFSSIIEIEKAESINLISICNHKILKMLGEDTNSFFIQEGCVHSRNYYAYVESDTNKKDDDFLNIHILECDICKKNLVQFQKIIKIVDAHLPYLDKNGKNEKELTEKGARLIYALYEEQMDKDLLRVTPRIVKKLIEKISNLMD